MCFINPYTSNIEMAARNGCVKLPVEDSLLCNAAPCSSVLCSALPYARICSGGHTIFMPIEMPIVIEIRTVSFHSYLTGLKRTSELVRAGSGQKPL